MKRTITLIGIFSALGYLAWASYENEMASQEKRAARRAQYK